MDDLLKKLNVLVNATINEMLNSGRDADSTGSRNSTSLTDAQADKQIATLRLRIDETLEFEDGIRARISALQAEVDQWNRTADDALSSGDEAAARSAIEQMNRVQRSLTLAQSDLREHQLVTEELILHVNTLEAALEAERRTQDESSSPASISAAGRIGELFSNTLQEMRDKINQLNVQIGSDTVKTAEAAETDQSTEDDLELRRQRLSKPK